MTLFVADTSVLMAVAKDSVSLDSILDALLCDALYVTKPVLEELRRLAQGSGEKARYARWILNNLLDRAVKVLDSDCDGKRFDDRIICSVKKLGAVLVTFDKEMVRKCRSEGVKVVVLRKFGRRLEVFTSA